MATIAPVLPIRPHAAPLSPALREAISELALRAYLSGVTPGAIPALFAAAARMGLLEPGLCEAGVRRELAALRARAS